jgi:hypothetical protein
MATTSTNPTTNRLAGLANLALGGVTYLLQGDFKYSPGTVDRETLVGMDQVHGYKETPRAPFIEFRLRDANSVNVASFNGMTGINISVTLANGKTITGSNMWTVKAQEVDSMEAVFDVRLECMQGGVVETGSATAAVTNVTGA